MEAFEEWGCEGVGSQYGDHHIDVHEKCLGCGVVLPGDLPKLHEITGL